jgi:hypothetical protein
MPPSLLLSWCLPVLALLATLAAQAQPEPIKFGKPNDEDFEAKSFVADSTAGAVVLCDFGRSRIEGHKDGFQVVFERVTRIKILKPAGFAAATVEIPLYHRDNQEEKVSNLRGFTYNLVDGQVQKTKLETSAVFLEKRSERVNVQKLTMPNVRAGSVVEYAYTLRSDFLFNFQDWTFQREIPVRWSEYRTTIPIFFIYKIIYQSYRPFDVSQASHGAVSLRVDHKVPSGGGLAAGTTTGSIMISTPTEMRQWVMKDMPAFRAEPYMTTANDYLTRLDFELTGEQWPDQPYHDFTGTWQRINAQLLSDNNFGQQLSRGNFLKPQMEILAARYSDIAARTAAVREVIVGAVRYDGTDRYATTASLRQAYDTHRGTSADVNLLLIAALRDASIPAQPVLLSTRHHGRINQNFPLVEKFNYVIALVPLADGKDLLVDATEPLLPCGMLPERCLSQTGRLITKKVADSRWVELNPGQRHVRYQQVQLALDAQGGLSGKVHDEFGGYAGADERDELLSLGDKKYQAQLLSRHENWLLPRFAISQRDAVDKALLVEYEFTQPTTTTTADGSMYLSPLREFTNGQNPFQHEGRTYPVDFGMLQEQTLMVSLSLPAGYELAELPKPAVVDLPNGGGRYLYSATGSGSTVQLNSRLTLRKTTYTATEYGQLREFYRLMLEKQAEKLIIRKKA